MEKLAVDVGLHTEELPTLPVLKCDLKDLILRLIGECLDLRIEHLNWRYFERRYKMRTVLNLLFALSAKDHGAKTSGDLYTEQMYGMASILYI